MYSKSGNPDLALTELDKLWEDAVEEENLGLQRWVLHWRGLNYIKSGSINKAQIAADELKELVEAGLHKKEIRRYYHLMGMIELDRENFSRAAEYFKKSISLLPARYNKLTDHASFLESLANAYYKAGDLDMAREEYEKIGDKFFYGDIYAKSFYMLGKIYTNSKERKPKP